MDLNMALGGLASGEFSVAAAFFIGLMAAISPCPLATNIAAIAYLSRNLESRMKTILSGVAYVLGRMLAYVAIAFLIVYLGVNVREISMFLQSNADALLGVTLLISGLVMLEAIRFPAIGFGGRKMDAFKQNLAKNGLMGSFGLGFLFALAFCPFSAVLYFGMLIPLALKHSDAFFIPASFSVATSLPVMVVAIILSQGASSFGKYLGKLQKIEAGVRTAAGIAFIVGGFYYLAQIL